MAPRPKAPPQPAEPDPALPRPRGRPPKAGAVTAGWVGLDFTRERALYADGRAPVAGADEVGRGPLAGPVVAAAVVLDPARVPQGLDDSKKLTRAKRESLYLEICATAEVAIALAPPERIDRDNIRQATLWALANAVRGLPCRPAFLLVDGNDPPRVDCEVEAIVGGDGLVASIAAASIVAKVVRDRLMAGVGAAFPAYGFERHMGYGTREHGAALKAHGPCLHHRRSFAPVREQQLGLFPAPGELEEAD
ncbi:Ribonuclease H [Xanthobacter versatilis]|uniref:Ribonuclease HII n=1 Tax=Xanthobacter autotrophicus (strain ATCC BAA-1158 / Py2) TaxID=78245 RepID=RNH2_XANP2|nr:RecName: Full=Ribonuclease HII; Short=RNase HII [Xanthobacter autotrophicus Py2]ABS66515.1 Ribonuclease H [Xanthobacter autotrophicus Py2]